MKSVDGLQDRNWTLIIDPNAEISGRSQESFGPARLQKQKPDLEGIAERIIVNVGMGPFMPRLSTVGRRRAIIHERFVLRAAGNEEQHSLVNYDGISIKIGST